MLERTEKPPTDGTVELHVLGPQENRARAVKALAQLGFVDRSDSIPWREAFPEATDENLPGLALAGARHKEGLTQRTLAEATGIPQRHISEMENHKRPIGKQTAHKLAQALKVSYKIFL